MYFSKKIVVLATLIVVTIIYFALPVTSRAQLGDLGEPRSSYDLGSAGILEGRNVIVTFFVDTPNSSWNRKAIDSILPKLDTACKYLCDAAAGYGVDAEFIYDWNDSDNYRYLYHRSRIPFVTEDSEEFDEQMKPYVAKWVSYLPSYESILEEYDADNVFMMIFFNENGRSVAVCYDGIDSEDESLHTFSKVDAGTYAHEILHLYGAHDYYEGAEYTKDVVSYIKKAYPNEIMLNPTTRNGRITSVVSDLTAYHLGWIDNVDEITKYPQLVR